jgi:hypothetical protein
MNASSTESNDHSRPFSAEIDGVVANAIAGSVELFKETGQNILEFTLKVYLREEIVVSITPTILRGKKQLGSAPGLLSMAYYADKGTGAIKRKAAQR